MPGRCLANRPLLLAGIDNMPDRIRPVITDEQRPVLAYGDSDRPAPELASCWIDRLADTVANAAGVYLQKLALRGKLEHVGAVMLLRMRVGIVCIRGRADRDQHLRSIRSEDYVAGPVAAAAKLGESGKLGDNLFRLAGRDQVALFIRKAHHRIGIADINPFGV